jgi:hypothetical protein
MNPTLILIAALSIALPVMYGTMSAKKAMEVERAYSNGKKVGAETVAAATTEKANDVVRAVDEGEKSAPVVSPDKAKIIELCQRSASCRDRAKKGN